MYKLGVGEYYTNVVGFAGSPGKRGNTDSLVDEILVQQISVNFQIEKKKKL